MYPIKDSIVVNKVNILFEQIGTNDCGLFAINYVDSICLKEEPSLIKYNQNTMRSNYNDFIDTKVYNIDKNYSYYNCERSFTKYLLNLPLL